MPSDRADRMRQAARITRAALAKLASLKRKKQARYEAAIKERDAADIDKVRKSIET